MMNEKSEESVATKTKRVRSKILYEITALIIVVLIASGLTTFFLIRASQNNLIEKSKERLIQAEIENISSFFDYLASTLAVEILERSIAIPWEAHIEAFTEGSLTEVQVFTIELLQKMAEEDTLGIDTFVVIITEWKTIPNVLVYASNDQTLVYEWDVPGYIVAAIEEGTPNIYMEEGIPELDLEGEHLIVIEDFEDPALDYVAGLVGFKSMHEEIVSIDDFYKDESRNISLVLGLAVGVSILLVILITFFILSYLIRTRITEPIEELSASAEQVMDGNLDVEIEVRRGEEFEGLIRAFKEMLDSIRQLIEKSTEEQ